MDFTRVLFEFAGIEWTLAKVLAGIVATVPALVALYKFHDKWTTRKERRHNLLNRYLDEEERDISAKRRTILNSIRLSGYSYLTHREFDVGREIDHAIINLDGGHPELAIANLEMLEKRLSQNEALLRKRADHLEKHRASVHIFLAALADRACRPEVGIDHIAKALNCDGRDLDALKYQGTLLLAKGDLVRARQSFTKLKTNSTGEPAFRADAYLGLAIAETKAQPPNYIDAIELAGLALRNINELPAGQQDNFTLGQVNRLLAEIYLADWPGRNFEFAGNHYSSALSALRQIKLNRPALDFEIDAIENAMRNVQIEQDKSNGTSFRLN